MDTGHWRAGPGPADLAHLVDVHGRGRDRRRRERHGRAERRRLRVFVRRRFAPHVVRHLFFSPEWFVTVYEVRTWRQEPVSKSICASRLGGAGYLFSIQKTKEIGRGETIISHRTPGRGPTRRCTSLHEQDSKGVVSHGRQAQAQAKGRGAGTSTPHDPTQQNTHPSTSSSRTSR